MTVPELDGFTKLSRQKIQCQRRFSVLSVLIQADFVRDFVKSSGREAVPTGHGKWPWTTAWE